MEPTGRRQSTATPSDVLGDLDGIGTAQHIASGEIGAAEALEAAIARTARVNPALNFVAAPAEDYGRARAAQALSGPFAGVPTLIKDLLAVTGLPLRFGCRAFAGFVAPAQSPYMDALLGAGLVPFGKSTTPEFGLTATTESALAGPTRNPWNPTFSTGGSSGGAAAAVASGAVPIAHASDGGGSIRIPSSCCGLFGLKISRDRSVPTGVIDPGISISVSGCVSRSVRDTAAWLSLTEQQGADPVLPPVGLVAGPNAKRLRILMCMDDTLGRAPHPHVKAAIDDAAKLCAALGHHVIPGALGIDGAAFSQAFTLVWASAAAQVVMQARQLHPNAPLDTLLEPLTIGLAEAFDAAPAGAFEAAIAHLHEVGRQYAGLFANSDVLLTPVLAKPPLPLGEIAPAAGMDGFARVSEYAVYTPLQNAAGAPAMSVPLSMSPEGLPIGAHFAAAAGQERMLLELAFELEQAAPWAARRPSVWAGA